MGADAAGPLEEIQLVDWRALPPAQRRAWWEQVWRGAVALSERYRLALRSRWWEDPIQVEALAAFDCWLRLYDTGAENDPTGKLQLLWELERLRDVLRGGDHAFDEPRDRVVFQQHLTRIITGRDAEPADSAESEHHHSQLTNELNALSERLAELRERRDVLRAEIGNAPSSSDLHLAQARGDLHELEQTLEELERREAELRGSAGDCCEPYGRSDCTEDCSATRDASRCS
jgi:hypothetical protein